MINVKDKIYNALCTVVDAGKVSDIYPQDFANMPAIEYTEEANNVVEVTDDVEQTSELIYRIDIWNTGSTSQLALAVDAAISALGLKRTQCMDVADPSGKRHKQMRYTGNIDNKTEHVYWEYNQ